MLQPNYKRTATALATLMVLAAGLHGATKGPDAGGYTGTDAAVYSFVDLVSKGGSASVLSGTDDAVALLTLPFPFQFYGATYTLVCVSSNGTIGFVSTATSCAPTSDFANVDLTSANPPGDPSEILPYWTDLTFQVPGAGAVYYQTQGTPGSRQFVVEWSNAYPQGSGNPVTFEAILSEGSNQILFQYQTVNLGSGNPATNGAVSTVGIRAAGGNVNSKEIAWSYDAGVLGNSTAILFTGAGATASVNTIATNPTGLQITINGVNYVSPAVVSWMPGSQNTITAVSPQQTAGAQYLFTNWSTGAQTPQISVQAQNPGTLYTANFSTQYQLTTGVSPANAGTLSGAGWYNAGSEATLQATASAGYVFDHFSGAATGSTNPQTLIMNAAGGVVANFRSTANPVLTAALSGKANGSGANQRVWTIRLSNSGLGTAAGAQITGAVLTQTAGTPCSPAAALINAFPVQVGDIAPATNLTGQVSLDLSGCPDTTSRFSLQVNFAANSGTYSGSTTINNQTR